MTSGGAVTRGDCRTGVGPAGVGKARYRMLRAGEFAGSHCSHVGISACAARANAAKKNRTSAALLRNHRKAHLLRHDVMGEVFRRNDQPVLSGGEVLRNSKLTRVRARFRVP